MPWSCQAYFWAIPERASLFLAQLRKFLLTVSYSVTKGSVLCSKLVLMNHDLLSCGISQMYALNTLGKKLQVNYLSPYAHPVGYTH